jgi:hypothetical protein
VPRRNPIPHLVKHQRHILGHPRVHRFRVFRISPMTKVQDAVRNPGRGPVRRHIAKPGDKESQRLVRGQSHRQLGSAQQFQRFRQWRRVKTDRQRIVRPLIPRHFGIQPHRKELARHQSKMLRG